MRKTASVDAIVRIGNAQLARANASQEFKQGIAYMIEEVLRSARRYRGFNYLGWLNGGCDRWLAEDTSPYIGPKWDRVYYL